MDRIANSTHVSNFVDNYAFRHSRNSPEQQQQPAPGLLESTNGGAGKGSRSLAELQVKQEQEESKPSSSPILSNPIQLHSSVVEEYLPCNTISSDTTHTTTTTTFPLARTAEAEVFNPVLIGGDQESEQLQLEPYKREIWDWINTTQGLSPRDLSKCTTTTSHGQLFNNTTTQTYVMMSEPATSVATNNNSTTTTTQMTNSPSLSLAVNLKKPKRFRKCANCGSVIMNSRRFRKHINSPKCFMSLPIREAAERGKGLISLDGG